MVNSPDFYNQYQQTYEKYRDLQGEQVCVFLQKGSFYEFQGQWDPKTQRHLNTGRQIIDLLGVVLHTYPGEGPNGTTGHQGGVPISHLDKWAGKLTGSGWSVVVIDEVKNAAGSVIRREVTRVLSAGTHVDTAESTRSFCVASLYLKTDTGTALASAPLFGVATADLTTGQVDLQEGQATGKSDCWHTDDLRHFFQIFAPRELLLFVQGPQTWQDLDALRRTLCIPTAPIHLRSGDLGALAKVLPREDQLRQMFQPKSALPFRTWLRCATDGSSLQELALTGLLRFAEDHAPRLAQSLQAPQIWHPTQNLQIVNSALTQLNLVRSSEQLCVQDLFVSPLTAMGKRSLTARLCTPLAEAEVIQKRQRDLQQILGASHIRSNLELFLGQTFDVSRLHRSLVRGVFKATDVIQLNQSQSNLIELWDLLADSPFRDVEPIRSHLEACQEMFFQIFDVTKATKAQDKEDEIGFLQDSFAPTTALAESKIQEIQDSAQTWLKNLAEQCGVSTDNLQQRPTEKNMFCVHVSKTTMKTMEAVQKKDSEVPKNFPGIQFKSLTSAGRIESQHLEKFQSQLDSAKASLSRALQLELAQACIQQVSNTRHLYQSIEAWLIHVDLSVCMARTAEKQGWVQPTIEVESTASEPSRVRIEHLRHPLIEVQKRQSQQVTHHVSLGYPDSGNGWLLQGMNASGKSSLMKAIGLAVLLAQVGSYVPATAMTLRPFRRLATRILNQDNLWAGLSSFAVEMSELREILAVADPHTLVLGDELCAGTESISGTAIVAAGIEYLHKAGARFVLATHLHDLMKLKVITELSALKTWHLHVEYDPVRDLLIQHRTLRPGSGSTMQGLEVAKALHLPREMIDAAFSLRRELLGTAAAEEAATTTWTADLVRHSCSVCGTEIKKGLEVHHLAERHAASQGRNADGLALNHVRNLAVLCEKCHDKHHAGSLSVGVVEDTSIGPVRKIVEVETPVQLSKPQGRRSPFSEEQIQSIRILVKANPGLSPKLWCQKIRKELEIEITDAQLKGLQKKGALD